MIVTHLRILTMTMSVVVQYLVTLPFKRDHRENPVGVKCPSKESGGPPGTNEET